MELENKANVIHFVWCNNVLLTTIFVGLVMLSAIILLISKSDIFILKIVISLFSIGLILYFISMTPKSIYLHENTVKIKKIVGSILIPVDDIRQYRKIDQNEIKDSNRDFGSGGFCGYLGKFSNSSLGVFYMYATNLNDLVLIVTDSKKYVISCSNYQLLDDFIKNNVNKIDK